jgi:hypothetical protein
VDHPLLDETIRVYMVLAAGPELVRWWDQASDVYGKAVITAALDARRVGSQETLTRDFLGSAAPSYLTPAQQATAPAAWLDRAIAYATTPLHGATSTLIPVASGMGQVAGYTVADYLYQHVLRARRTVQVPGPVWQALVDLCHSDDAVQLGESSERRGRYCVAEALYRKAADAGDRYIVGQWPACWPRRAASTKPTLCWGRLSTANIGRPGNWLNCSPSTAASTKR